MTDEQIFNGLLEAYELSYITDISSAECCREDSCTSCPASPVCVFLTENKEESMFYTNLKAFHKRYTQKHYPEYLV